VSPTVTTFLFELANFLLLAALVGWLLFKPVRAALETRQTAERQRVEALAAREQALKSAGEALEARKAAFDADTLRLRKERLDSAETEAAAIIDRARRAADRQRDLEEQMQVRLDQMQAERLSAAVAAAARTAVSKLLTDLRAPDLDRALATLACRQLESTAAPGAVIVESADALDEPTRQAIAEAVGGRASSLDFRLLPTLGAGLRVTTSSGVIDVSAAGLAGHTERALVAALARPDMMQV